MTRKTKALKEHEIENYFIWQVEIMGGRTFKFKTPTQRGVSDRIACLPNGDTWFVELKRPKGGFVSPMQALFAESMVALKQQYVLLNTAEAVNDWAAGIKL